MQVFLSHSSADRTLADALKQLLSDYFDGRVTVVFSSLRPVSGVELWTVKVAAGLGAGCPNFVASHIQRCRNALAAP